MPTFQYSALDSQGVEIKDEIDALSQKEAISKIRNLGYFPTKVRARGAAKKTAAAAISPTKRRGAGGKVKVKPITQFARQLSTLQDAGLPILRSLWDRLSLPQLAPPGQKSIRGPYRADSRQRHGCGLDFHR